MKLDISAAPELALLAGGPAAAAPVTVGGLARGLWLLAADPQAWRDLVRFDPLGPVQASVAAPGPACEAWLLVLPPGGRGAQQRPQWPWDVACLVAGAIAGPAGPTPGQRSRPLVPGRIRVRGGRGPHHLVNTGSGYAVSLHARVV
jgi:hypothetical protein